MVPNRYSEWRNFQFAPNSHNGFFFLHTLPLTYASKLENVLFYQFYSKISIFFDKKSSVQLLFRALMSKHLAKKWLQKWRCTIKKTPWCLGVRRHFLAPVSHMEILVCKINWATSWQNQQNDCAPSEDSDQPGHQPSLIRVFPVHIKKAWVLSYALSTLRRLWSDWADAQADLSLRWAHSHFVGFVMSWLSCCFPGI